MKRFFLFILGFVIFAGNLYADTYKYFYKNGKKYRIKIVTKDPNYTYKYFYKNGKKYRIKIANKSKKAVKNKDLKETKLSNVFISADFEKRNYFYTYKFKTKRTNKKLTAPGIGSFITNGENYAFVKEKSQNGLVINVGYYINENFETHIGLYNDIQEVEFRVGAKYQFNDLFPVKISPYAKADLNFVFESLEKLSNFKTSQTTYKVSVGAIYNYKNFFVNLEYALANINFEKNLLIQNPEDIESEKHEIKENSSRFILGAGYRF